MRLLPHRTFTKPQCFKSSTVFDHVYKLVVTLFPVFAGALQLILVCYCHLLISGLGGRSVCRVYRGLYVHVHPHAQDEQGEAP